MFGRAHNITDDDPSTNLGSSMTEGNSVTNSWPTLDVVAGQSHQDNPNSDAAWWEGASANNSYIHPHEGGVTGVTNWQGYSTGLTSAHMTRAPLSGRVLRFPQTSVLQNGPVGLDNRGRRLDSQVAQQTQASMPDMQTVARDFVSQSGARGIIAAMRAQRTGNYDG